MLVRTLPLRLNRPTSKSFHSDQKDQLNNNKRHRLHAFFTPKEPTPDIADLITTKNDNTVYRLMSYDELHHNVTSGLMGNNPDKFYWSEITKRPHLEMAEHVQENNSRLLSSYSADPNYALNYATINFIPNFYLLVKAQLPPVFTTPSDHKKLDEGPFTYFHEQYLIQERNRANENRSKYVPPVDAGILCENQREVDMVIKDVNSSVDFRPTTQESIKAIFYVQGRYKAYNVVNDPTPFINQHLQQRGWAFEVVCPVSSYNYENMCRTASNLGILEPGTRLFTIDDAVAIFPEFNAHFKASCFNVKMPVHIIKKVPAKFEIGSKGLVKYLVDQHSIFRNTHNFALHATCNNQSEHNKPLTWPGHGHRE